MTFSIPPGGCDVRCLQEGRQVLVDIRDDALDLLQSTRARVCFVFVIERRQQIQIFTGLCGDVLDGSGLGCADLLAGLQRGNNRADVQSHLNQNW